jgi:hypothetical protein
MHQGDQDSNDDGADLDQELAEAVRCLWLVNVHDPPSIPLRRIKPDILKFC